MPAKLDLRHNRAVRATQREFWSFRDTGKMGPTGPLGQAMSEGKWQRIHGNYDGLGRKKKTRGEGYLISVVVSCCAIAFERAEPPDIHVCKTC